MTVRVATYNVPDYTTAFLLGTEKTVLYITSPGSGVVYLAGTAAEANTDFGFPVSGTERLTIALGRGETLYGGGAPGTQIRVLTQD